MTKSKVAKKFHLDPDGYLTTKPDRELTTEEEATDAAEAAIEAALGEGGAIAEAIAASGGSMVVTFTPDHIDNNVIYLQADKTFEELEEYLANGGIDIIGIYDPSMQGGAVQTFHLGFHSTGNEISFYGSRGAAAKIMWGRQYGITYTSA